MSLLTKTAEPLSILIILYAYEGKVLYQIGNLFGGYSLKHTEFVLNITYRKNLKFFLKFYI